MIDATFLHLVKVTGAPMCGYPACALPYRPPAPPKRKHRKRSK